MPDSIGNTALLLEKIKGPIMNYPSISRNEMPRFSPLVIQPAFSILGLILVLFACGSVHAQSESTDSPPIGQSAPGQYKRGETPTGQQYGIIKKGEPHKSEAAKKSDRSDKKPETKPRPGSFTERDPRETSEGSGPDPFGRY